ncbi:hypothetical protein G5B38_17820 [Pseudohalocynthiibacter aestuariivivens]|uniref:Major facilitator superfamily (MFS) profile domain-containing protein n=1 Tax=Roseovarius pelagicus TaxID=2980108 RepID=A0ABY6DDI4_9RHOB|nr:MULTISPECIES: hypothetical protein [Rhodobacterales]QIE47235.1 hypothetical protein G5B38_17820 [Pseudohalocynthiibacter aestuariivivens]UXX84212.1 hypothetical protein N7U68_06060 [Roseovarius pelagicus]
MVGIGLPRRGDVDAALADDLPVALGASAELIGMEGSSDILPVLVRLASAFLFGAIAAFMACADYPWRYVFVGWIGCAALCAGLFWVVTSYGIRADFVGEVLGFLMPAGLLGGALGAILGLIWYQDF